MEFVEFSECGVDDCSNKTDLGCVSCSKWFCEYCMSHCVQCQQHVCSLCYKEDMCCLIRPWGEKTERHLRDLYQNKLIDVTGTSMLHFLVSFKNKETRWNDIRKEVFERSILYFVERFDASNFQNASHLAAKYFPRISKYVENEEARWKFLFFMEELCLKKRLLCAEILLYSKDREQLLSLLHDFIQTSASVRSVFIRRSLEREGEPLFDCLKRGGLLDWDTVKDQGFRPNHAEGMKWIESNGIDVLKNESDFDNCVRKSSPEVMEYLIVEKGMRLQSFLEKTRRIDHRMLKAIYKIKGLEEIQKIDIKLISFTFDSVSFLRRIGYKFDKREIIREKKLAPIECYSLLCFDILKHKELSEAQKREFSNYVSPKDPKSCKQMYPFMKEIRKRKIMTFLLCVRKLFPREIIWMILDHAFTPAKEKGSF